MSERQDGSWFFTADEKRRWLEALRSREYMQGRGCLVERGRYCCLGVGCQVLDPMGFRFDGPRDEDTLGDGLSARTGSFTFWPHAYSAALSRHHPALWEAVSMNDRGRSFAEIADYLEQHLETEG